ncbi:GOLGB1 [Lepeophtheirus salmonis]|uniref:GOLGB1 n=1 Tax=Lepeophtheirus salmonis TaxID=72036 RepID=A0A7R8CW48_LEPSM|nr:GOLGB1 [Lepeophtheirus salmonis]CAF2899968.1 GOLGB1 [Lepeophtheirus salmonis]
MKRDTLVQQVNEMNMRLEGQRSTEEGLHLQLSGLTTDLRGFEQREAELNHIISQMKESSAQEIESFSTQNNDASDTVESLRHENECLNTRCSQLVTELESKYMECANLTQQLETIITQQQNETVSAFAPPPDVTQYQQQPDVALHSIPQPDIMPSGYVDLVQQPSSSSSLYPDPLQSSQNLDGANFFDPSLPVSSNNQHQPLPSSSYPPIDNQHIHSIQEVQTELTLADIDNLIMLESLNHQFLDLQNEISLLRDENMTLHATLSQNQKDSEESNASAEIVPSTSLDNVNSEVLSSHVDSVAPVEQSIMATSIQQENNNNSLTLEWYKEQFTTYQTAINNWQEWGRVKTEELDGYVNAYNEVSNELLDARSAIEVKMVEMSQLSQIVEQLTNEIQEMRRKDELVKEKKSYNAESWRSKLRAKEIEIQDLTETVERLKSEKEELMEEVNELREKNESLRSDRVFSEELEDLKFQLDEIVEEKRTQSLEMESIMKKYQTISSNEDNLNKINQKLQADIDASNKIVRKLESDIKANENEIKDREAIAENAKLTLKNQVDELQKENQNLELSIDSYKRQIEKLQKDLENEKFNNSTLFNEKLSEIESYTANTAIVEWSSWGQTKITEYDTLLKSYEEYVAAYNSINSELSLSESDKLKEEIQNVRLRNGKLTMRSKQMEKELEAIKAGGSSSADDMTELRAANFELNKNASSLQIELSQSSKSLEELNNERINLSERVIDLENRIDILNYDNELTCETQSMPESLQPENSFSHNEKLLIAQLESELQQKSDSLQNLEFELSRLRVLGDTERLELDKSLRENRQLNSQMNYWKQQIYTEQQIPGSNSTQNELHCARQAASAFQVQVEQLTTELTKLQEERDTLQLKLSNVMRQYERQRESSSRASTACSTPIPWVDPSLVEIKELKSKIEELGNLNYALDIELQKERQTRENMQARLRHPSSSSSSSTPVHLPHKPTTSDLSSLSGGQVLHL